MLKIDGDARTGTYEETYGHCEDDDERCRRSKTMSSCISEGPKRKHFLTISAPQKNDVRLTARRLFVVRFNFIQGVSLPELLLLGTVAILAVRPREKHYGVLGVVVSSAASWTTNGISVTQVAGKQTRKILRVRTRLSRCNFQPSSLSFDLNVKFYL